MKYCIILLGVLSLTSLQAQDTTDISGGGVDLQFTSFNNQPALMIGGFGFAQKRGFIFGGGGYGLVSNVFIPDEITGMNREFSTGYGGVIMGYEHVGKTLRYSGQVMVGFGGYEYGAIEGGYTVLNPRFNVSFPISSFLMGDAGIIYRYIIGVDPAHQFANFSGPALHFGFRFH